MTKQECVEWPGAALVTRLPGLQRTPGAPPRSAQSKSTMQRISRLVMLKRYVQARLNEVARVLRMPPPNLQLDHHGNASIDARPVTLDLAWVEGLRQSETPQVCALTLLRASLASFFEHLLPGELLRRLLPATVGRLACVADFLSGYVLAAFRATFETRRAFLAIAPLPDDQNPAYHERLFAFEQGQLAFQRPAA